MIFVAWLLLARRGRLGLVGLLHRVSTIVVATLRLCRVVDGDGRWWALVDCFVLFCFVVLTTGPWRRTAHGASHLGGACGVVLYNEWKWTAFARDLNRRWLVNRTLVHVVIA